MLLDQKLNGKYSLQVALVTLAGEWWLAQRFGMKGMEGTDSAPHIIVTLTSPRRGVRIRVRPFSPVDRPERCTWKGGRRNGPRAKDRTKGGAITLASPLRARRVVPLARRYVPPDLAGRDGERAKYDILFLALRCWTCDRHSLAVQGKPPVLRLSLVLPRYYPFRSGKSVALVFAGL